MPTFPSSAHFEERKATSNWLSSSKRRKRMYLKSWLASRVSRGLIQIGHSGGKAHRRGLQKLADRSFLQLPKIRGHVFTHRWIERGPQVQMAERQMAVAWTFAKRYQVRLDQFEVRMQVVRLDVVNLQKQLASARLTSRLKT